MTSNEVRHSGEANELAEALGIQPIEVASMIHAGYFYYENGRLREAQDLFEAIALLDRLNPYVYGILGSIFQKQKKYDEAITSYTIALNLFPEDPQVLINRGEVYLNQGKMVEAFHDFEEAIRLDTNGNHPAANRARLLASFVRDALRNTKGISSVPA